MVFSTKDVAVVAGLGVLAFLIIRGGRDLAGALGNLELPSLPSIGDISFPEINIPNPFGGGNITNPFDNRNIVGEELGTPDNPANNPQFPTPIDIALSNPFNLSDEQVRQTVRELNTDIGVDDPNNDPNRFQPTFGRGFTGREEDRPIELPPERPLNLSQFTANIQTQEDNFNRLPPVGESLNELTQRLGITASQAADLRFRNEETDFDFGSNTGSGIGGIFTRPDINTEFGIGNVSNPDFEGLSAIEIAQRLTGNISNF